MSPGWRKIDDGKLENGESPQKGTMPVIWLFNYEEVISFSLFPRVRAKE